MNTCSKQHVFCRCIVDVSTVCRSQIQPMVTDLSRCRLRDRLPMAINFPVSLFITAPSVCASCLRLSIAMTVLGLVQQIHVRLQTVLRKPKRGLPGGIVRTTVTSNAPMIDPLCRLTALLGSRTYSATIDIYLNIASFSTARRASSWKCFDLRLVRQVCLMQTLLGAMGRAARFQPRQ